MLCASLSMLVRIQNIMKEKPVLYKTNKECCGCSACFSICPRNAISMIEDGEGFEYPVIDEDKCISCLLCLRVCPFKNNVQ